MKEILKITMTEKFYENGDLISFDCGDITKQNKFLSFFKITFYRSYVVISEPLFNLSDWYPYNQYTYSVGYVLVSIKWFKWKIYERRK